MKYLQSNSSIMGGRYVITGTRIPIEVILYHVSNGYTVEEIHKMWSYVDIKILKGAIQESADILSHQAHARRFN